MAKKKEGKVEGEKKLKAVKAVQAPVEETTADQAPVVEETVVVDESTIVDTDELVDDGPVDETPAEENTGGEVVAEEVIVPEPAVEETVVVPEVKEEAPIAPVAPVRQALPPLYMQYFAQFVSNKDTGNHERGIQALKNVISTMLAAGTETAFAEVLVAFKSKLHHFDTRTVLRESHKIPATERIKIEVVAIVLARMANGEDIRKSVDVNKLREMSKSVAFSNWVAKRMAAM